MDILTGVEFDIFVPSFPEIQNYFNQSTSWIEALISFNFAGYCISLFFVGRLADKYGRKPVILIGLAIFVLGSIFCLLTQSYDALLLGRFLQGVGIAAPATLSILIISDTYPLKEQSSLIALLNGSISIAMAVAPVIGSCIAFHFSWQGNFILLLVLGTATLIITNFFIPNYALSKTEDNSLLGWDLSVFRCKSLILLVSSIVFMFVPYWIFTGISPLLYIKNLGVSITHFGYYQGSIALSFGLGSLLYGLIVKKRLYNQKKILFFSIQILPVSFIIFGLVSFLNIDSPVVITLAFLPFIIGHIIPTAILYPACLNFAPKVKGQVSTMIQGGRLIFASIGLQITGYFYQNSFRNIGVVISCFIFISITVLFLLMKDKIITQSI